MSWVYFCFCFCLFYFVYFLFFVFVFVFAPLSLLSPHFFLSFLLFFFKKKKQKKMCISLFVLGSILGFSAGVISCMVSVALASQRHSVQALGEQCLITRRPGRASSWRWRWITVMNNVGTYSLSPLSHRPIILCLSPPDIYPGERIDLCTQGHVAIHPDSGHNIEYR